MLLSIYLSMALSAGTTVSCDPELFRIGRSKNANEVVYLARQAPDGRLDADDPLRPEWHMLAEDVTREGLKFSENLLARFLSFDSIV